MAPAVAVLQAAAKASQSGQQAQHRTAIGSRKAAPRCVEAVFTQVLAAASSRHSSRELAISPDASRRHHCVLPTLLHLLQWRSVASLCSATLLLCQGSTVCFCSAALMTCLGSAVSFCLAGSILCLLWLGTAAGLCSAGSAVGLCSAPSILLNTVACPCNASNWSFGGCETCLETGASFSKCCKHTQ